MPDSLGNPLDRYLAGELSGPEQRDLAQVALDDPELFDALTAAALIKTTLRRDSDPKHVAAVELRPRSARPTSTLPRAPGRASVRPFQRPLALAGIAASAAAAIALVMVYRSPSTVPRLQTTPSPTLTTSIASAVIDPARITPHPLILIARLDTLAGRSTAEFRADLARSRPPKSHGVVVSVDDGEIAIDLGSLDGVAKGSELQVFRGDDDAKAVGQLTIVTVFRERSRGRVASAGSPRVGDRAEVAPSVQVAALLEQVAALMVAGDTTAARALANRAVSISRTPGVPSDARRHALGQLGTLEHRAGVLEEAERHLRGAVDVFDAEPAASRPERAEILNELGAVLIERGDYPEAERTLLRAQPHATGAAGVHVANNLAALAALRRDTPAAESMYRSALALAGNSPDLESDRRAILKNLESLKTTR
jgi:Tfp pilus assembly protein PilF